jgi:hypothetical protein
LKTTSCRLARARTTTRMAAQRNSSRAMNFTLGDPRFSHWERSDAHAGLCRF